MERSSYVRNFDQSGTDHSLSTVLSSFVHASLFINNKPPFSVSVASHSRETMCKCDATTCTWMPSASCITWALPCVKASTWRSSMSWYGIVAMTGSNRTNTGLTMLDWSRTNVRFSRQILSSWDSIHFSFLFRVLLFGSGASRGGH